MMVVLALSLPIERDRRDAFLRVVAGPLAASPAPGAGVAHRAGGPEQVLRSPANVGGAPADDGAPVRLRLRFEALSRPRCAASSPPRRRRERLDKELNW